MEIECSFIFTGFYKPFVYSLLFIVYHGQHYRRCSSCFHAPQSKVLQIIFPDIFKVGYCFSEAHRREGK